MSSKATTGETQPSQSLAAQLVPRSWVSSYPAADLPGGVFSAANVAARASYLLLPFVVSTYFEADNCTEANISPGSAGPVGAGGGCHLPS